ncbi:MAG TPA: hypothetical protein VGH28_32750 [Polyangiaceae bacterium]
MTDATRVRASTLALFVLGAWPLLLCRVPPLQDLPAHLATAVVIRHPEAYPNFVFHGFAKTNSSLFVFLHAFGDAHLFLAGKLFVALVVLAHAWVFPRLALELGGRGRVLVATMLAAPLVHNWFVAMGMLDYALGSALALACVLLAARQLRAASASRGVLLGALGILVWYTHIFALALLALLGAIECARTRSARPARAMAPLAPAFALAAWSAGVELVRPHAPAHAVVYRPPWETVYELWAKYAWSFSKLELASLVVTLALAVALVRGRRDDVPFLSLPAAMVLLALVFVVPSEAADWFAVNSRFLPFLYAAALVRAPADVPRWATGALGACALACSIGLGVDYARLARDFREVAAGAPLVPEDADLYPVMFDAKGSSENTWALVNAWGLYVVDARTSAPLLFAHSPSFPIGYRTPPPKTALSDPSFAQREHGPEAWRAYEGALAERGWVLEWGTPPAAMIGPIARHELAFESGRLRLFRPLP